MHFSPLLFTPLLALALASATAYKPADTSATDLLAAKGLLNLAGYEIQQAFEGKSGSCNLGNVAVRREW